VSTANAQFVESTHLSLLPVCFLYNCNVTSNNDNVPVAALERPLPLLGVQRLSTTFNTVQHLQLDSTLEELAVLKRVEHLSAVTFRTSLEGRSTRSVGRELLDLKRSVRVHANSPAAARSCSSHGDAPALRAAIIFLVRSRNTCYGNREEDLSGTSQS
jgi:hypothetical protein